MRIASHNTFTYLPVRKWWMKPLAFSARCQRVSVVTQYEAGARMFDIRLRYDNIGIGYLCHGLIEYEHPVDFIYDVLDLLDKYGDCYVRMVLETTKPDEVQEIYFRQDCKRFSERFKHIKFIGGNNRTDWLCEHPIYEFSTPLPSIDNQYASSTSRFDCPSKVLRYIDDLYPLDYAKKYNHKILEKGTTFSWLMIDFVDIQ